ncbi:MAG: hypothetical protein ACLSHW_00555 [Lachnospiraceae bacterium]
MDVTKDNKNEPCNSGERVAEMLLQKIKLTTIYKTLVTNINEG